MGAQPGSFTWSQEGVENWDITACREDAITLVNDNLAMIPIWDLLVDEIYADRRTELENYFNSKVSDEYAELYGQYIYTPAEGEQAQLKVEITNLQREVEVQERQIENLEQFIQRVRRYTTLEEITPYALRELVKAVYVEAPDKSSGKRRQKIHIEYDGIGFIPLEELAKKETA